MLHITTIVHGGDFNILLPIAKYGNLKVFLNRGLDKDNGSVKAQTLYNFETVFPRFRDPLRHQSILSEMYALADALLWLHRDVNILNDPNIYCGHMDLKPSSILIDSGGPDRIFGKWMITDFGISVFRHVPLADEGDEKEDVTDVGVQTVGDLGARLEPKTAAIQTKQQHKGTYQPPEAYRLGVKRVGRKSDIWSFGCVLSEVLAFALGDEDLLEEFRTIRVEGFKNDYFYNERKVVIDGEDNRFLGTPNPASAYVYEPKYAIHGWLSNLLRRYPEHGHWLHGCVELVKSTLEIDTKCRADAVVLTKTLKKAVSDLRSLPLPGRMVPSEPTTDSGYASATNDKFKGAQDLEDLESDDARTVYSDASSLPALEKDIYISELADDLFSKIGSEQLDGQTTERISGILPELLKAFALKIGHNAPTQMHRDIMFFVHKYRR